MVVELTPQTLVTAGAILTAALLLIKNFASGVRWFDKQEKQSTDHADLKAKHDADVEKLENELSEAIRKNKAELRVLTRGILACLKGLHEKGCNGPVTEAAKEIEEYLNTKAHES